MNLSEEFANHTDAPPGEKNVVYMDNPEEMLKPWVSNPMFFEIAIIHGITFVFGLLGNAVVIAALAGDRRVGSATNTFLVSLAAGDLLMLCVNGPLETCYHFVIQWDENSIVCKAAKYAELLSATSSVLNLLAVTIERFIVIMFPMKSRIVCTSANTTRAVMVVWFLAIILALPIVFTTGTYQFTFANNETKITLNYCDSTLNYPNVVVYHFLVVFAIPCALLIVCYTFVIKELWASTRQMSMLTQRESVKAHKSGLLHNRGCEENANDLTERKNCCVSGRTRRCGRKSVIEKLKRQKTIKGSLEEDPVAVKTHCGGEEANSARKQVIKMLILVVIMFFICWGPRLTMDVLAEFGQISFNNMVYRMRITFNIMTFIHGCLNPFIYCFMSRNFRTKFLKFLEACGVKLSSEERKSTIVLVPSQHKMSAKRTKQEENADFNEKCSGRGSETKHTDLESVVCVKAINCGSVQDV